MLPFTHILKPGRVTTPAYKFSNITDQLNYVGLVVPSIDVSGLFEADDSISLTFAGGNYTDGSYTVKYVTFSTDTTIVIDLAYSTTDTGGITIADNAVIRKYVDWSDSMDAGRLSGFFRVAQEIDLRAALGNDFYEDYVMANAAAQSSIDSEYYPLLPYIYPVLVFRAYAYYLEDGDTMQTRTGGRVFNDQNSAPIRDTALQRKVTAARSTSIMYEKRMQTFIEDNISNYTDYSPKANRQQSGRGFIAI